VVIELGAIVGDVVTAEQMLLVVESDKASMDIVAPADGVVAELKVSEGDSVGENALLVVLSGTEAGGATPESSTASTTTADAAVETPAVSTAATAAATRQR